MLILQVDRFEEGFAVLADEQENTYSVPKDRFGFVLHEGDVLEVTMENGKPVFARYLAEETEKRSAMAKALMEKLRRK